MMFARVAAKKSIGQISRTSTLTRPALPLFTSPVTPLFKSPLHLQHTYLVTTKRHFASNRRPGGTLFPSKPATKQQQQQPQQEYYQEQPQQYYPPSYPEGQAPIPPQPTVSTTQQTINDIFNHKPQGFPPAQREWNFQQQTTTAPHPHLPQPILSQQLAQPQQPLKWYQQSNSPPPPPPNKFFQDHPILYQIFQTMLMAIGMTIAFSLFR